MPQILPSASLLAAFLAASFVLAVTPGPGVLYIVTRSTSQGRAAGLASVAGVALGNLGNATAASFGLAALFAISSLAFSAVRYLGAAYLIYLGVRALRSGGGPGSKPGAPGVPAVALRSIFVDGFFVALLNPKTALFFAAFLPQFLPPAPAPAQTVLLGALFVLIASVTDTGYALASGFLAPWLSRAGARGLGRYLSGCTFIGLGILAAMGGHRAKS